MVDDGDPLGHAVGFIHVMGGEKHRDLLGFIEMFHVGPELVAGLRVETEGRLIEKKNLRRMQKSARDFQAALHASGESLHIAVAAFPKLEEPQQSSMRSPRTLRGTL